MIVKLQFVIYRYAKHLKFFSHWDTGIFTFEIKCGVRVSHHNGLILGIVPFQTVRIIPFITGFKYYLQHPDLEWTCAFCSLPKLSDSIFDETGSFTLNESNCEDEEREVELVDTDEVLAKIKDIRIEHRKECVIACLNINSLQNKFDEVRLWLATNAFDILTIQETKIDSTFPSSQFHVDGFNFYRRDRVKGCGGIVVYIRDNIAASRKKLRGKCVESMLFDMKIGRQFAYINAYKPPSVDNNTFKRELYDLLDEANSLADNVIFSGDLNSDILHPLDNHKEGQCLLDMCEIYDLDSLINVPTRISKNRESWSRRYSQ